MSAKGEEVLDNWEEMDEVNLNSKLDKLKQEAAKMNTSSPLGATAQQQQQQQQPPLMNGKPMKILMMDDDYRSQQYGPVEPTVKILRRPAHERNEKSAQDTKPKVPVKTLQQREHEYAQARLRILGSARSPEETTTTSSSNPSLSSSNQTSPADRITSSMNGNGANTNGLLYRKQPNQHNQQLYNDCGAANSMNTSAPQYLPATADGVIRLPRGPDGSTGFTVRR